MAEAYVYDAVRTPRGRDIFAACGQLKRMEPQLVGISQ